jgi:hypothetical protein
VGRVVRVTADEPFHQAWSRAVAETVGAHR